MTCRMILSIPYATARRQNPPNRFSIIDQFPIIRIAKVSLFILNMERIVRAAVSNPQDMPAQTDRLKPGFTGLADLLFRKTAFRSYNNEQIFCSVTRFFP